MDYTLHLIGNAYAIIEPIGYVFAIVALCFLMASIIDGTIGHFIDRNRES